MDWDYCIAFYLNRHCPARDLTSKSIASYQGTLKSFREYVRMRAKDRPPGQIKPIDVLGYLQYLREVRHNGAASVKRHVTVLTSFYGAVVAAEHMEARDNPMVGMPRVKGPPRRLAVTLDRDEVKRLLASPDAGTVLGRRDRAILILLCGTGIRASECSGLNDEDIDFKAHKIKVTGKGGHERVLPLTEEVEHALAQYRLARGAVAEGAGFFRSRKGRRMSRGAIYERVRRHAAKAHIRKKVSPHRLRHTFATHLMKAGAKLPEIQRLLGHQLITSTQIYVHMTAEDLRHAAEIHPISGLIEKVADLLPDVKLPFQRSNLQRFG
jgi:integrase/recombinase XerD